MLDISSDSIWSKDIYKTKRLISKCDRIAASLYNKMFDYLYDVKVCIYLKTDDIFKAIISNLVISMKSESAATACYLSL